MKIRLVEDCQLIITPEGYTEQLALEKALESGAMERVLIENYKVNKGSDLPPITVATDGIKN